jgi:hypothetical protein
MSTQHHLPITNLKSTTAMNTQQTHPSSLPSVTQEKTTLALTVSAAPAARRWNRREFLPFALFGTAGLLAGGGYAVVEVQAHRQRKALLHLQDQMRADLVTASAQDTAALAPLRAELARNLQPHLNTGMAAVPQASEALGSFSDCFHLIVRQGVDLVKGTASAQDYIAARLGRVAEATVQMQASADAAIGALAHEISGRSQQLAARWLHSAEQLPTGAPGGQIMPPITQMVGAVDANTRELHHAAVLGLGELGIAAYLNRQLLMPVLRPYVNRAVGTVGANIALAAADGPLPFGEIISVLMDIGFSVWTAWDIYWLSKQLPGRIAQSLQEGLHTCHAQTLAAFDQAAPKLLEAARLQRQQSAAPVLAIQPATLTSHA